MTIWQQPHDVKCLAVWNFTDFWRKVLFKPLGSILYFFENARQFHKLFWFLVNEFSELEHTTKLPCSQHFGNLRSDSQSETITEFWGKDLLNPAKSIILRVIRNATQFYKTILVFQWMNLLSLGILNKISISQKLLQKFHRKSSWECSMFI